MIILWEKKLNETTRATKASVSIVIPVYSGASYLRELMQSIERLRETWVSDIAPICILEVIFVDDDSIDGSPKILNDFALIFHWVRVIHLSKNFGQHPATIAGILQTSGDWVVNR